MSKLTIKIVTPERVVFEGSADSLSAMTENGEVTILPHHVSLVSLLRSGEMRLRDNGQETLLAVSTGVLEVRAGSQIIILADTAERSEELELEKIEAAKNLAQQRLLDARAKNDVAYADAAAHLERELARYRVATKHKYRGSRTTVDQN